VCRCVRVCKVWLRAAVVGNWRNVSSFSDNPKYEIPGKSILWESSHTCGQAGRQAGRQADRQAVDQATGCLLVSH
jgi:hypothetical protein